MEKKIATSVEVLIKVAQYESIRVTKYGEAKIEYDSPEEMRDKEDELSAEVIDDLDRCVRKLPEKFSKASETIVEDFGGRIEKVIPKWLEDGPEPNIANVAKKSHESSNFKADVEEQEREATTRSTVTEMEELFGPDPDPAPEDEKKEEPSEKTEVTKIEDEDEDDLFS